MSAYSALVATDALVLKYHAIRIHGADQIAIASDQFQTKDITFIVNMIRKWK